MSVRNRIFSSVLLLFFILSACSSKTYNYETAIENGDIVDLHGNVKNAERLEKFYENISLTIKDKIRITQFTIEGDPLFNDFQYNGKEIKYIYDNSKDTHGKANKRATACKSLINRKTNQGVEYTLEGCYGKNKEIGQNFKFIIRTQNASK
jgi:NhaP-type Na+/H+ and K+/H+ antiporter